MNNDLSQKLENLGLDRKESIVLSYLLSSKRELSLSDIEKLTHLPKTTVHRIISSLVKKGIASWKLGTQGKIVGIDNPTFFLDSLRSKQDEFDSSISFLEDFLQQKENIKNLKPVVRYYEGVEGIKQLIWNTLSSETELLVYTNVMRKDVVGDKWLVKYCMEFMDRDLRDRVLCDINYANNSYQRFGGREKYFLPVQKFYENSKERVFKSPIMLIKGETYIYNNTFATYTLEGDNLIGCEIESKDIADTQKSIFDNLWSQTTGNDSIDSLIGELV
jgi:sugar-specific transcriptional regulator TrmB